MDDEIKQEYLKMRGKSEPIIQDFVKPVKLKDKDWDEEIDKIIIHSRNEGYTFRLIGKLLHKDEDRIRYRYNKILQK